MNSKACMLMAMMALGAQASQAASEGGDTWSALASLPQASVAPKMMVATIAQLSELRADAASMLGSPITSSALDRSMSITDATQWINVGYGERVQFTALDRGGASHSFAWRFDVSPMRTHVDLSEVAPADFPVRSVRVFIAHNPNDRGG
jgi:hypothetical protein